MKSAPIPAWGILIFGILLIQIGFINNSSLTKTYFTDFKQTFGGPITNDAIAAVSNFNQIIETNNFSFLNDTDALYQTNSLNYKPSNKNKNNYFSPPTVGWNWGILHDFNAVDIANKCGTEIYASAEGLIIPDKELGDGAEGFNGGYGIFILIEHPNGAKTRYAHLQKIAATVGRYVEKGELIGYMGNTGNTHGPTGCHLHFEVYGDKNPLVK